MPGKYLYEYAIIRLVPRVEREEFINVGVIVFSRQARFIKALNHIDESRVVPFLGELELSVVCENLKAFDKICKGDTTAGKVASWEMADRFRWLTAVRSSSIQTSRPHNGFSNDLENTVQSLLREQVL